jgi:hypothetical protein
MDLALDDQSNKDATDELNQLLEIGKLLASVLTKDELASLHILLGKSGPVFDFDKLDSKLGNTGVT